MERLGYAADVNSWGPGSTMCNRSQEIAMRTHLLLPILGLLSLCPVSAAAQSEAAGSYPERPVKVIVPYAAGAAADVIGRIVAQKLSEYTGTQFYVENLPGAGSVTGTVAAARAPGGRSYNPGDESGLRRAAAGQVDGPLQSVQELRAGRIHCVRAGDDFGPSVDAG